MARKARTVSMTAIRKALSQCQFDPKKGGPLKIIIDSHHDNPRYLENRAIEMVHEAQLAVSNNTNAVNFEVYALKLQHAITLLAIAMIVNQQFAPTKKE